METYKTKSLTAEFTDKEISTLGVTVTRFISFEAIIRAFQAEYSIKDKPIGYEVTEQGVVIRYK